MNESDYKTIAIENGNTANRLAERLREAENEVIALRADLKTAVRHNAELSYQAGRGQTGHDLTSLSDLIRLVRTGEIDLTITLTRHEE